MSFLQNNELVLVAKYFYKLLYLVEIVHQTSEAYTAEPLRPREKTEIKYYPEDVPDSVVLFGDILKPRCRDFRYELTLRRTLALHIDKFGFVLVSLFTQL